MIVRVSLIILMAMLLSCTQLDTTRARLSLNNQTPASMTLEAEQKSGSITIVKQVPKARHKTASLDKQLFALKNDRGSAIIVDRLSGSISLKKDNKIVHKIEKVSGLGRLDGGKFKIVGKKRRPLWYAPDSYFSKRKLPIPGMKDDQRYLRGALGEYALFINAHTAIHNSPFWTNEVGGIKINEQELTKLYYQIDVGTPVLIL